MGLPLWLCLDAVQMTRQPTASDTIKAELQLAAKDLHLSSDAEMCNTGATGSFHLSEEEEEAKQTGGTRTTPRDAAETTCF